MAWYLVCFLLGIVAGLIIEDQFSTETKIEYNGKVKQKGENNTIFLKQEPNQGKGTEKERKWKIRREERKIKRKNKRANS